MRRPGRRRDLVHLLSIVQRVPGVAAEVRLTETERWRLAGEYTVRHRLVGPWHYRICATCGTRGRCAYSRWANAVLTPKLAAIGAVGDRVSRSPFTPEYPPPRLAPPGCPVVIGWELAASVWLGHRPDPLNGGRVCSRRGVPMPCPCWRFADAFLADAATPAAQTPINDPTRELPQVQRPLPRLPQRRPGAHLEAGREVRRMVYAVGLVDPQPRIDSTADCGHCAGPVVWDEVYGWLHLDGWYACRWPGGGAPREVMAAPAEEQP
jgi:hypothetical protein